MALNTLFSDIRNTLLIFCYSFCSLQTLLLYIFLKETNKKKAHTTSTTTPTPCAPPKGSVLGNNMKKEKSSQLKTSMTLRCCPPVYAHSLILTSCCACLVQPGKTTHCIVKLSELQLVNLFPSVYLYIYKCVCVFTGAVFRSVWETHEYHSSTCKYSINCSCYPV